MSSVKAEILFVFLLLHPQHLEQGLARNKHAINLFVEWVGKASI